LEVELRSVWGRVLAELYSDVEEVHMCLQRICSHAPNQVGIGVEVSRVGHTLQVRNRCHEIKGNAEWETLDDSVQEGASRFVPRCNS